MCTFIDEPEVFLPKYPQTVILRAARFRRVVHEHILTLFSFKKTLNETYAKVSWEIFTNSPSSTLAVHFHTYLVV